MKKHLIYILAALLFISTVNAADVAYLIAEPSNANQEFIDIINELGLTYELVDTDMLDPASLSSYSVILVNDQDISNAQSIPINDHPSIMLSRNNMVLWGWSYIVGRKILSGANEVVVQQEHPITRGLSLGNMPAYNTSGKRILYMDNNYAFHGIENIVSTTSHYSDIVIGVAEAGDILTRGPYETIINADSVFFGIYDSPFWTDETRLMFKNSFVWLLDVDEDGYIGIEDCDETDSDVNSGMDEVWYNGIDDDCNPDTVDDPNAPVFVIGPYTDPIQPYDGSHITIYIQIDEPLVDDVVLYYSVNGGAESSENMNDEGSGLFSANIGSYSEGDIIDYYIWVDDTSDNEAQTDISEFTVAPEPITFDLMLNQGYTLISIPLVLTSADVSDLACPVTAVKSWDGSTFVDVTTLENNVGYFVYSTSACTETLDGIAPTGQQSVSLVEGYNLVGITSLSNIQLTELPAAVTEVAKRNSDGSYEIATYYEGYDWYNPFELEPGKGYWFKAASAVTWEYAS